MSRDALPFLGPFIPTNWWLDNEVRPYLEENLPEAEIGSGRTW